VFQVSKQTGTMGTKADCGMTNNYWTVELRQTDHGIMHGAWHTQMRYASKAAAIIEARKLTTSCLCGERLSYLPENVRVREWAPVKTISYTAATIATQPSHPCND
jgi:hypothetical protein